MLRPGIRSRVGLFALALLACSARTRPDDEAFPVPTLRVAAVQMRSSRDWKTNVARIQVSLRESARAGARVAVFPECALTGYFEDVVTRISAEELAEAERRVAEACRESGIYAIVGTPRREGRALYDSAVVIAPSGRVVERYDKIQLAEAWPTPGDHLSVFPIDGVPCSIIICHDERYPELVRLPVLAGARVVFYVSHESGVGQPEKIGPYRAQIQARAVENTVYVVHANAPSNADASGSHGQSRIIKPDGNIIQEASIDHEEVVTATLDLPKATAENADHSSAGGKTESSRCGSLNETEIVRGGIEPPTPGFSVLRQDVPGQDEP